MAAFPEAMNQAMNQAMSQMAERVIQRKGADPMQQRNDSQIIKPGK
jgi:hypothetical protein